MYTDGGITAKNGSVLRISNNDGYPISDAIAPALRTISVNGASMTLKFDEKIRAPYNNTGLVLKDDQGQVLRLNYDYTISTSNGNEDTLVITVIKPGFNSKVRLSLNTDQNTIIDVANNKLANFNPVTTNTSVVAGIPVIDYSTQEITKGVKASGEVHEVNTVTITATSETIGQVLVYLADGSINKTVSVTGLDSDPTRSEIAEAVASTLNGDADIRNRYTSAVDGNKVVVTANNAAADRNVLITVQYLNANLAADNSVQTVAGSAGIVGVLEVNKLTIKSGSSVNHQIRVNVKDGNINRTVGVNLAAGDSASDVASKIRTTLLSDATVSASYTISGNHGEVILTAKSAREDRNVEITITQ